MHIIQHVLLCVLELWDTGWCDGHLAYVTVPDAMRGLGVPRPCTHFERGPLGASWYAYPTEERLREVDADTVARTLPDTSHLASDAASVKGDDTDLSEFARTNAALRGTAEYDGILVHLVEDVTYDRHILRAVDCSGKREGRFELGGTVMDGRQFRESVTRSELRGISLLCSDIRERRGIDVNNGWLDANVMPLLARDLSPALAGNQRRYLDVDGCLARCAGMGDQDGRAGITNDDDWERMYADAGRDIVAIANGDMTPLARYALRQATR